MEKNSLQVRSGRAEKGAAEIDVRRRNALAKLGIAAGVAYTAPVILWLDRAEAHAGPTICEKQPAHGNPSHCA